MYKTQGYLSTTTYNYTELWVSLAASLQIKEEDREVLYDPTDYMYLQLQRCYNMVMSQTNISTLHDIIIYVYWTNKRNALF